MGAPVLFTLVSSLAFGQINYDIDLTQGSSVVLEPLAQTDWRWAPFAVGPANKVDFSVPPADRVTIGRCGCFLTVLGMSSQYFLRAVVPWFEHTQIGSPYLTSFQRVLSYSPKYLDDYFNFGPAQNWTTAWAFHPDSGGRVCGTVVHPWAATGLGVDVVSQKPLGLSWKEYGNGPQGFARVDEALRQGRPTLVNRASSSGGRHFNIIVGWDTRTQRYLIWDPMWGREGKPEVAGTGFFAGATDEERYAKWKEAIVTLMPLRATSPHFLLYFQDDPEPIELSVIDPSGRRTGFDPALGAVVQQNLNAWYSVDSSFDDPLGLIPTAPLIRTLTVDEPELGTYGLEVFGTGTGHFTVRVGAGEGGPWTPAATLTGDVTQGSVKRFEVHLADHGVVTVEEVPAFFPRARAGNGVVAFVSDTVAFDGRGSYEIGGSISSFEWDFGDGATASGAQVTHAYASPGTYAAKLTVRNAAGLSAVAERGVLVISPVPGETVRASVAATGAESTGGGSVNAVITPDGRFVAFESYADNLVPNDTNFLPDIFVKDLMTGAIERVSVTSSGAQALGAGGWGSLAPSISSDGRFVAFHSDANNLAADALGIFVASVYVHDRVTGMTEAVSRGNDGVLHVGQFASISGDGRYVAFESTQSVDGVAPAQGTKPNIFVRDRQLNTVRWASRTPAGDLPDVFYSGSVRPKMSEDGRYVAFDSDARNLVLNDPNGYHRDVFVRDLVSDTLSLVNLTSAGTNATGHSMGASISADGRYVAFHSDSSSYEATDTNGTYDVFVRDRQQGTTTLASRNSLGAQADRVSVNARLSPSGRFLAFFSRGTNLAPNGADVWQVYLRDLQTGETSRVSVSTSGTPASPDVLQFVEEGAWAPSPANEGTVTFFSMAANLVPNDTNGKADIFVRKSTSSPVATTPLANLLGPYVGWASSAAVPSAIAFDASGSRDPRGRTLSATWDFGDGTPEAPGPLVTTHAFTAPGRYTVKVRVSAGTDVSTAAQTQVEVQDAPPHEQLSFFPCAAPGSSLVVQGASPAANAALVASGWDRSTGPWTAADVTLTLPWAQLTVPTELPGFTFSTRVTLPADLAAGTYALSVAGGASASLTVPCPAVSNHAPSAHAGGPVYSTTKGASLTFDGTASSDPEGSPLAYAWDFGDGETGTGPTPSHSYQAPGDYFVTLVVNDGTFDSPTTVGTHSFAMVNVADVTDGGVVLETPPDLPAASTKGCGCASTDLAFALWLAWLLTLRRRR